MTTSVYYIPGLQWGNWRTSWRVLVRRGLSAQIQEAYGVLAARYRPGDRIYMFGYSRGAFAVRSLSGIIVIAWGYCFLNLRQRAMWTVFGGAIADRGDQRISNRATVMGI